MQANEETDYLFALFPGTPKEQLDWWAEMFLRFEQPRIRIAIKKYYEQYNDPFIDRGRLRQAIMDAAPGTRSALDREIERRHFIRRKEMNMNEESWRPVDEMLRGKSEAELMRLRGELAAAFCDKPVIAEMIARADMAKSKMLRALIFHFLRGDLEVKRDV